MYEILDMKINYEIKERTILFVSQMGGSWSSGQRMGSGFRQVSHAVFGLALFLTLIELFFGCLHVSLSSVWFLLVTLGSFR